MKDLSDSSSISEWLTIISEFLTENKDVLFSKIGLSIIIVIAIVIIILSVLFYKFKKNKDNEDKDNVISTVHGDVISPKHSGQGNITITTGSKK